MKLITLVIAEHNEGDQLKDTLESLYETSDRSLYDVIVVSDGSEVDPKVFGGAIHLNTGKRRGVGAAFDLGAEHVKTPYMVIMGSDVRFVDNGYLNKMVAYLSDTENEKSIITSVNVGLNADQMEFDEGRHRYGARTCFFLTAKDLPKKGTVMSRFKDDKAVDEYRNILEAKWIEKWGNGIYDISCVLGAFYGVRTDWYRHIMGFRGHRYWGTLEPFISLKSWFAGGKCRIATDIETAHIFKARGSHFTEPWDLIYNKIAIATILFSDDVRDAMLDFIGYNHPNEAVFVARELIEKDREFIEKCRDDFRKIKKINIHDFRKIFPFKDYGALEEL